MEIRASIGQDLSRKKASVYAGFAVKKGTSRSSATSGLTETRIRSRDQTEESHLWLKMMPRIWLVY